MGLATGSLMGLATLTLGWLGFTATQQPTASTQAPSLDKRVTASMTNASMDEVLQWLRRTGVNFVIDKNNSSTHAKLNLNIVDKPLKDVMEAIASAVGGSWQKHGDIYSLRRGGAFGLGAAPPEEDIIRVFPPNMDEMRILEKGIAPKTGEPGEWRGEFDPKASRAPEGLRGRIGPDDRRTTPAAAHANGAARETGWTPIPYAG
ncbi:MAG: hypothetical protein M3R13_05560 [Armatimonadota bacterium]|nr:hypothetical protein [Armatimonadota bacterium]